jgi:signal transduction histidine kinase/ActR/RegA family two-component response regulator
VNQTLSERALILAPRGRDAAIAAAMLAEAYIQSTIAADVAVLVEHLRAGAGFAVVTEEALRSADLRGLAGFIGDQAEWSDFPFILLTEHGGGLERNPAARRFLETLGNVTFLERPFHPTTLMSLARAALRARRRQYEARSRLEEIREGERALRDLAGELERRVEERTRDLIAAEEALRQSQKMEAVGQLTGGLAHDFNNLLTGISGSLQLMQTRLSQGRVGEIERYITAAEGAARRAASLTHRLLAFSRRQTLDPKPININRLISDLEDLIRRTVGPSIQVEFVGAAGLWTALVDPNQLENALLNLCINARDAMPDGGRLTIETANKWLDPRAARERELSPGQYLSLCVTDTGTGMTPEVIKRAFDPFFTTKPLGQGTGLGLSMIYGFARQSGGQVRIYSEIGKGTTMCIYLPRHQGREDDAGTTSEWEVAPHTAQGETVLVVDDEPTVRMLITEVLQELGYTAIEVADGSAGLQVLRSDQRIDLLITDVGLPGGINGRQVADGAREVRPDLKVLFITGYAENAVVGNGHLEPGMQVLAKPFPMEALASRVKDLMAGTLGSQRISEGNARTVSRPPS